MLFERTAVGVKESAMAFWCNEEVHIYDNWNILGCFINITVSSY